MSAKTRAARRKAKPVMNVTPLVDVVLVLLIIFMVVIPAMDEKVRLTIPSITQADERTQDVTEQNAYTLAVTSSGALHLDSRPVNSADLEPLLRAAHRAAPNKKLVLRGDVNLRYGAVRRLYATAQRIGFPGVLLRVNKRQGEET